MDTYYRDNLMPSLKIRPSSPVDCPDSRALKSLGSVVLLATHFLTPLAHAQPLTPLTMKNVECTSADPERAIESILLPGGGEVETIITRASMHMNFYLDGERVLTVSEADGRVDVELTEHGLALEPERAAEFRDEVVSHAQAIMESSEGCSSPLASKADENFKCALLGGGAAVLGAIGGTSIGGPIGGILGGAFGKSLGDLCNWLVNKVCEENPEGC